MHTDTQIPVWDPVVRLFHWSLAAAFAVAFVTEDDWLAVHVGAGYTVLGLLALRLVWGFVGTRHARFADFVRPPAAALAYLRLAMRGRAPRYLGHNPAGGWMVLLLMTALLATGVTGLAVYALEEGAGPLAGTLAGALRGLADAAEELHEWLANATLLLLVAVHIGGVLIGSLMHRENLVRAMITGRKCANGV